MAKKLKMSSGLSSGLSAGTLLTGTSNITGTANYAANSTITLGNNVNAIYGNGHGSWGSTTIQQPKITYVILGEEYEVESGSFMEASTASIIATLNVLGKPYWLELKKQQFSFGYEMDKFIEERITVLDRDKKINDILK
jgi:hypothetical protein